MIKCSLLIVGGLLSTPPNRSFPEEQKKILAEKSLEELLDNLKYQKSEMYVLKYKFKHDLFSYMSTSEVNSPTVYLSTSNSKTERRSVYFSKSDYIRTKPNKGDYRSKITSGSIFPKKETAVYMTLFDQFCRYRTSGTQATASINKSFQVSAQDQPILPYTDSEHCSTCSTASTFDYRRYDARRQQYSELYFFSKKRDHRPRNIVDNEEAKLDEIHTPSKSVQAQTTKNSSTSQTHSKQPVQTASLATTTTSKTVSIKEPNKANPPGPGPVSNNGSTLMATVSHIKIGPTCLVHGPNPCHGPNCVAMGLGPNPDAGSKNIVPNSDSESKKVPVKVTTISNPRRGVFELVIRRMNGAPLARNELMLEWSPPQIPSSCEKPAPLICSYPIPLCRPQKCKMPVCRTLKCRSKKRCKFSCGMKSSPCAPCSICGKVSCQTCPAKPCIICKPKCSPRRSKTCKPCKPCKPSRSCRPCCPPFPFKPSSYNFCCNTPGPCSKPCKSIRRCKYPKTCRPSACRPCGPCTVYRACVPDLACPASKTSIVFKPCSKKTKSCDPCTSTCFTCYPCIPITKGNPFLVHSSSYSIPRNSCDADLGIPLDPCISSDPCIPVNHYNPCDITQPYKS